MGQNDDGRGSHGALLDEEEEDPGRWSTRLLAGLLVSGRSLTTAEDEHFERMGAACAARGERFDTALARIGEVLDHGYRSLLQDLEDGWLRHGSVSLADLSLGLMRARLETTEALARGFVDGSREATRAPGSPTADFVRLLVRVTPEHRWLREEAEQAGLDPDQRYGLIVALKRGHGGGAWRGVLDELAAVVPGNVGGQVARSPIAHAVVLHRDAAQHRDGWRARVTELARRRGVAVAAVPPGPIEMLGERYRRLRAHLVALSFVADEGAFMPHEELSYYELLASRPGGLVRTFVGEHLGSVLALPPNRSEPLLSALRAFFASDGNVVKAARALQLHPKGAAYRLNRVAALTGLRPHGARDGQRIQLALHLLQIHRTSLPPLGDSAWSEGSTGNG